MCISFLHLYKHVKGHLSGDGKKWCNINDSLAESLLSLLNTWTKLKTCSNLPLNAFILAWNGFSSSLDHSAWNLLLVELDFLRIHLLLLKREHHNGPWPITAGPLETPQRHLLKKLLKLLRIIDFRLLWSQLMKNFSFIWNCVSIVHHKTAGRNRS